MLSGDQEPSGLCFWERPAMAVRGADRRVAGGGPGGSRAGPGQGMRAEQSCFEAGQQEPLCWGHCERREEAVAPGAEPPEG